MLQFLSSAWVEALDRAAAASDVVATSANGVSFVLQQRVHDGPRGDAAYHVTLDHRGARVLPGAADDPSVSFETDYATAVAISTGTESAQAAFMDGRLRIGGDVNELLRHTDSLLSIDDIFAAVRGQTAY